jgi:hypothetical protein
MGTNCAPLLADLFLYSYESEFLQKLVKDKKICVVPDKYRNEIESKCFKFIWDGKPDKVKRNTMIGNFEMGGLNMIDIGSYFASLPPIFIQVCNISL